MPDRIKPCLALLASKPPAGDGHDWTNRFPTIPGDVLDLGPDSAILDGEAVVLDERGASDFGALQQALGGRGGKRSAAGALLYAFDLLYLNGRDLRPLACEERREMLPGIIKPHTSILFSADVDAEGDAFLALACKMGLEGIIAKRRDAPYRSGRGGEWLKIKCIQSEGFFIIGYEPSWAALGGIGRLLLAAWKNNRLTYVGGVGTGFTDRSATALRKQLDALLIEARAETDKKRDALGDAVNGG
ncbi:ATP-dependent DNA ligase [Bosea sp. 2YAB26]|uniref:ATP-dependent DNA ligase n=1 Tax=Bosea sp. 2YAB26 TaxID=3237478 RepID=UPI003F8E8DD2